MTIWMLQATTRFQFFFLLCLKKYELIYIILIWKLEFTIFSSLFLQWKSENAWIFQKLSVWKRNIFWGTIKKMVCCDHFHDVGNLEWVWGKGWWARLLVSIWITNYFFWAPKLQIRYYMAKITLIYDFEGHKG